MGNLNWHYCKNQNCGQLIITFEPLKTCPFCNIDYSNEPSTTEKPKIDNKRDYSKYHGAGKPSGGLKRNIKENTQINQPKHYYDE